MLVRMVLQMSRKIIQGHVAGTLLPSTTMEGKGSFFQNETLSQLWKEACIGFGRGIWPEETENELAMLLLQLFHI